MDLDFDFIDMDINNISDIDDTTDDKADNTPAIRRYIRDRQNPFEQYDDDQFKMRFRFNKESVLHGILPKIIKGLAKINNRGLPIPPQFPDVAEVTPHLLYNPPILFSSNSNEETRNERQHIMFSANEVAIETMVEGLVESRAEAHTCLHTDTLEVTQTNGPVEKKHPLILTLKN